MPAEWPAVSLVVLLAEWLHAWPAGWPAQRSAGWLDAWLAKRCDAWSAGCWLLVCGGDHHGNVPA